MTVGELIEQLSAMDPTLLVIMQKDGEGNGYSPLYVADGENNVYEAETTWSGEVRLASLSPELIEGGYSEEDVGEGVPCCVLAPTN